MLFSRLARGLTRGAGALALSQAMQRHALSSSTSSPAGPVVHELLSVSGRRGGGSEGYSCVYFRGGWSLLLKDPGRSRVPPLRSIPFGLVQLPPATGRDVGSTAAAGQQGIGPAGSIRHVLCLVTACQYPHACFWEIRFGTGHQYVRIPEAAWSRHLYCTSSRPIQGRRSTLCDGTRTSVSLSAAPGGWAVSSDGHPLPPHPPGQLFNGLNDSCASPNHCWPHRDQLSRMLQSIRTANTPAVV